MRPEFVHLIERLDKLAQSRIDNLAKGGAKDFAEYKHSAGFILGLKQAAQEIEDYGRAYDDDDS